MRIHVLFIVVSALLAAILAVVPSSVGAQTNAYERSPNVETGNFFNPDGVLYGYLGNFTGGGGGKSGSYAQVSYHESQTEEDVSIVHVFSGGWDKNFNQTFGAKLATLAPSVAAGKIPMYSLGNPNLGHMNKLLNDDPGEIAKVRTWATQYRNSGIGPMFARLAHEADRPDRAFSGNPDLFISWWQKFVDVVETDAPGYTAPDTLIWQFSPTAWGYWHDDNNRAVAPMDSRAAALYPGDAYVDWIGSSGYDYPCAYQSDAAHRRTHEQVLEPVLSWASQAAPSKPFMLAEWGSENTVGNSDLETRADFFATTDDMLRSNQPGFDQIGAMVYFDRHHNEITASDGSPAGCNWLLHDPAPAFPNPNLAYDQGGNAAVSVTNASDFAGYKSFVNTPGLFVPLGSYEADSTPNPTPNPNPADFNCTVVLDDEDAIVLFSGDDMGTAANLRNQSEWIDTVTDQTRVTVPNGAGNNYEVVLNDLSETVACTGGIPLDITCSVVAQDNDALVTFWGDEVGAVANLFNGNRFAGTVTGEKDQLVRNSATDSLLLWMNTNRQLETCESTPAAGFTCTSLAHGADAEVFFWGDSVGTEAQLRNSSKWVADVAGQTSAIVAGGASDRHHVRLDQQRAAVDCDPTVTSAFSCSGVARNGRVSLSFDGAIGTAANVLRNGEWIESVPGRTQFSTAGAVDDQFVVKLHDLETAVVCSLETR